MTDPVAPGTTKKAKIAIGAGCAAALTLCAPLVMKWEGRRNDPYADMLAGGLMTVCYGETRAPMRRYSDAECKDMLLGALEARYMRSVLECTPGLRDRPYQLAAATSLSYNIGSTAYCRSTAARRFNAGDLRGGCRAISMWTRAGGRVVQGLVNRRADEVRLCLKDVA